MVTRIPPVTSQLIHWIQAKIPEEIILGRIEEHYFEDFSRTISNSADYMASYHYDILFCKESITYRGAPPRALELLSEFGRRHSERLIQADLDDE